MAISVLLLRIRCRVLALLTPSYILCTVHITTLIVLLHLCDSLVQHILLNAAADALPYHVSCGTGTRVVLGDVHLLLGLEVGAAAHDVAHVAASEGVAFGSVAFVFGSELLVLS